MTILPVRLSGFLTLAAVVGPWALSITAQPADSSAEPSVYRQPPKAVRDILEAPAPAFGRISPNRKWLMEVERDYDYTSLAELAEPYLVLAGQRFKRFPDSRVDNVGITRLVLKSVEGDVERVLVPPTKGRIDDSISWVRGSSTGGELAYVAIDKGNMQLHLYDASTGVDRVVSAPGLRGKIGVMSFTLDGRFLAFAAASRDGTALWIVDTRTAVARRVQGVTINHVNGGFMWTRGHPPLIARVVPEDRGAVPAQSALPAGPIVQESYGKTAPSRNSSGTLRTAADEALFEYYSTNQIVSVDEHGKVTRLGKPGIHQTATPSPNGDYILVNTVHRPYSKEGGVASFPRRTEVWTREGKLVKRIYDSPRRDGTPAGRDAVYPGVRSIVWRTDAPATLMLLEALDDGDPTKDAAKRDRLSFWPAPFEGKPSVFVEFASRYAGVRWAFPDIAFVSERSSRTARSRTWIVNPQKPDEAPRLVWDRNIEDQYSDPGTPIFTEHPKELRDIPLRSADGRWMYLRGVGAAKDGAKPFLDRLDLTTLKTERLWQSTPPYYENLIAVLDSEAKRILFTRESPAQRSNMFYQELGGGEPRQLSNLPEPAPWFAQVKGEQIQYKRSDGTLLTATLYLPPGYSKERDGPLPFFFWAYPREFLTEEGASQVSGSPLQFRRPPRADHLLLLALGYGVLDNPKMPIVAREGKEPNDEYVPQLVASARAAVDHVVGLGVADRQRIAIGGHSYGAFMTANLLAHTDLFRAGIARSGAYNRTLTPFGFQAEPRNYWQAPETYTRMSPFTFADRIKEPILLIHGMRDGNLGTQPIQSERMYAALRGNGGNVRYVQLPLEDHSYAARESRGHVLWEMATWLDKYVKNGAAAGENAAPEGSD